MALTPHKDMRLKQGLAMYSPWARSGAFLTSLSSSRTRQTKRSVPKHTGPWDMQRSYGGSHSHPSHSVSHPWSSCSSSKDWDRGNGRSLTSLVHSAEWLRDMWTSYMSLSQSRPKSKQARWSILHCMPGCHFCPSPCHYSSCLAEHALGHTKKLGGPLCTPHWAATAAARNTTKPPTCSWSA